RSAPSLRSQRALAHHDPVRKTSAPCDGLSASSSLWQRPRSAHISSPRWADRLRSAGPTAPRARPRLRPYSASWRSPSLPSLFACEAASPPPSGPRRIKRRRAADRQKRGLAALTQGMLAVAAGDSRAATRHARDAEGLLNAPPLTLLLGAQAAQLAGDAR